MAGPLARASGAPRSLAASGLPRRVRRVLERALALVSSELDAPIGTMLTEFEQELFRLADLARNPGAESGYMQTLRTFRMNRSDLLPRFMLELEAGLAQLRTPVTGAPAAADESPNFRNLSLVDNAVLDEGTVLREVASRQEGRANLALHLLGQRFGVLAGMPAFDAERLPLGPQALCRAMRDASVGLEVAHDARLLLYRVFDRQVMTFYARVIERMDAMMVEEGILPGLTHVPMRTRAAHGDAAPAATPDPAQRAGEPAAQAQASGPGARGTGRAPDSGRPAADDDATQSAQPRRRASDHAAPAESNRPHTAWMGEAPPPVDESDEAEAFEILQQLMSGRRELIGKLRPGAAEKPRLALETPEVVNALGLLQKSPGSPTGTPRTLIEIKQTLLAQARQRHGQGAALSPRDSDTFELLSMLYGQIEQEVREDAPAAALLRRLQLPLLRVALQDRAFFVRSRHPARQLLNTVAESAAKWLDPEDFDPQLLLPLQQAVTDVLERYDGDNEVFESTNRKLQEQMQQQVRKAEMLERRHVDAARGKEKLEVAKQRAAAALVHIINDQRLPKFTRALLNQAWTDVLTLTLLRQGEDSPEWQRQLEATGQIVGACARGEAPADGLATHIEHALSQVGYHGEEAAVIAQRLTSSVPEDEDPASRTELAMKLKARTRLGEETAKAKKPKLPPRTPEEQMRYEQLRVMPFGSWLEFVTNQQGDVVRRRLSWFSPVTDNALFVNQRGQRIGEHSLDTLARMIVAGQARIVTSDRGRLVDRAWQAAMGALRSFAGRSDQPLSEVPA